MKQFIVICIASGLCTQLTACTRKQTEESLCKEKPKVCLEIGMRYLKKACDAGYSMGCYNLGMMWRDGKGGRQNPIKAQALFKKACNAGNADACIRVRKIYPTGKNRKP